MIDQTEIFYGTGTMNRSIREAVGGVIIWIVGVTIASALVLWLMRRAASDGSGVWLIAGVAVVGVVTRWVYNGIAFARRMSSFDDVNSPNEEGFYAIHLAAIPLL